MTIALTDTPETPERARRIGRNYELVERIDICPHCSAVLIVEKGRCIDCDRRVTTPGKIRVIDDAWPLHRLFRRGALGDRDGDGKVRFLAGQSYYRAWYVSGLSPLPGMELQRVQSSHGSGIGMPTSERAAHFRRLLRRGEQALGNTAVRAYVDAIVLWEEDPTDTGHRLSGRIAKPQATAVALEMLKEGLDKIAEEYGL